MPREIIATVNAPNSPFFSQAARAGPFIIVSGTTGIDPVAGRFAASDIEGQTRQALMNCKAILEAGGANLDDVVEVGVLLASPSDFAAFNDEYARWFPSDPPARYVAKLGVEVSGLLVSIRMTAFVPER